MALVPVTYTSPGRWGINLQEQNQVLHSNWATKTDGLVLNKSGQLAARGSITKTTTTPAAAELLRIFNYVNAAGAEVVLSTTATKIWQSVGDLTAAGNDLTSSTAPSNGYWKFINFNGNVLGFQKSHTPIVNTGSGDFTDITAATGTLPTGDVAHAAFGRVWAVRSDLQTVGYSALLDHTKWAAADGGGSIDMRNVWTQGLDYVTGISSIGSNLVIFGRRHIVIYTDGQGSALGLDPAQMYVVDVVEGTGCVSRDSITPIGEGDLVFLSDVGVQSLGRVVQSKDNPLVTVSWQIQDRLLSDLRTEISAQSNAFDDVRGFTGLYIPRSGQFFLFHKTSTVQDVFVFHMDQRTQDDKGRELFPITLWDTSVLANLRSGMQKRDGTIYFTGGAFNHINTYSLTGTADNSLSPIPFDFESGWIDWGDPEFSQRTHVLKFVQATVSNPSALTCVHTLKYGTDYVTSLDTLDAAEDDADPMQNTYDPTGDIDGQHFKLGLSIDNAGGQSIQQLLAHFKPGRMAFVHNKPGQGVVVNTSPSATLQLLIAVSDSSSSTACVATSMDGKVWTARTGIQHAWKDVCYSPDLHLAVAVATGDIMSSPDGITWTARPDPGAGGGGGGWTSVCWSRPLGKFIAVGTLLTTQRVMTSTDGLTWTLVTTPASCDKSWVKVIWSDNLRAFVATFTTNAVNCIMTSPDGVTWTLGTTATGGGGRLAESTEGLHVVLDLNDSQTYFYSTDGINWTKPTSVAEIVSSPTTIAYSPSLDLFAMASGIATNGIVTGDGSSGPVSWSLRATTGFGFTASVWSVNLGLFVFINSSASNSAVEFSTDGVTWSQTGAAMPSTQNWFAVCETESV